MGELNGFGLRDGNEYEVFASEAVGDCGNIKKQNVLATAKPGVFKTGKEFENKRSFRCYGIRTYDQGDRLMVGLYNVMFGFKDSESDKSPCKNGGTCSSSPGSYLCKCQDGWTGNNCDQDIDECQSNPCKNGGTCHDQVNGFRCSCQAGYAGKNCEKNIDECQSNPCAHGGTCHDQVNGYRCKCQAGFRGNNCETNIDECRYNPCQNGGTCKDQVNGYSCSCNAGYN